MIRLAAVAVLVGLLGLPAAKAATLEIPTAIVEQVAVARQDAAEAAREFKAEKANGKIKSKGLARAAEVSKSWKFTGEEKPGDGNGRALGQGRSAAVHEALANGVSPSTLENHGQRVSAAAHEMNGAFEKMKEKRSDHPGGGPKGEAKGKAKGKNKAQSGGDDD